MKAIEMQIKGLKCDNIECDYKDDSISFEQYENYLNAPCPKCGEPLLTEADYINVKILIAMNEAINKRFPDVEESGKRQTVQVKMNGTGDVQFVKK